MAAQADKLPAMLSGGEQQRVAVARALANSPRCCWRDEPTGNLDSATARSVADALRALAAAGTTVVVATHDRQLWGLADRAVELADGQVVAA